MSESSHDLLKAYVLAYLHEEAPEGAKVVQDCWEIDAPVEAPGRLLDLFTQFLEQRTARKDGAGAGAEEEQADASGAIGQACTQQELLRSSGSQQGGAPSQHRAPYPLLPCSSHEQLSVSRDVCSPSPRLPSLRFGSCLTASSKHHDSASSPLEPSNAQRMGSGTVSNTQAEPGPRAEQSQQEQQQRQSEAERAAAQHVPAVPAAGGAVPEPPLAPSTQQPPLQQQGKQEQEPLPKHCALPGAEPAAAAGPAGGLGDAPAAATAAAGTQQEAGGAAAAEPPDEDAAVRQFVEALDPPSLPGSPRSSEGEGNSQATWGDVSLWGQHPVCAAAVERQQGQDRSPGGSRPSALPAAGQQAQRTVHAASLQGMVRKRLRVKPGMGWAAAAFRAAGAFLARAAEQAEQAQQAQQAGATRRGRKRGLPAMDAAEEGPAKRLRAARLPPGAYALLAQHRFRKRRREQLEQQQQQQQQQAERGHAASAATRRSRRKPQRRQQWQQEEYSQLSRGKEGQEGEGAAEEEEEEDVRWLHRQAQQQQEAGEGGCQAGAAFGPASSQRRSLMDSLMLTGTAALDEFPDIPEDLLGLDDASCLELFSSAGVGPWDLPTPLVPGEGMAGEGMAGPGEGAAAAAGEGAAAAQALSDMPPCLTDAELQHMFDDPLEELSLLGLPAVSGQW